MCQCSFCCMPPNSQTIYGREPRCLFLYSAKSCCSWFVTIDKSETAAKELFFFYQFINYLNAYYASFTKTISNSRFYLFDAGVYCEIIATVKFSKVLSIGHKRVDNNKIINLNWCTFWKLLHILKIQKFIIVLCVERICHHMIPS